MTKKKVKIIPITLSEHGFATLPVTQFRVIDTQELDVVSERIVGFDGASSPKTDEERVLKKIQTHSITPTTFEYREFDEDITSSNLFVDHYTCDSSSILRFGINSSASLIEQLHAENIRTFAESPGLVQSTTRSEKYTPEQVRNVLLSGIECELLNRAIAHLMQDPNIQTVLIDIFARVNGGASNGMVKLKDDIPETHTVLLYKPLGQKEIVVIDPNNFLFSSHLSNLNTIPNTVLSEDLKIKTFHTSTKIYVPNNNQGTGPHFYEYRNCIDVAAKIAFEIKALNAMKLSQGEGPILIDDIAHIKNCEAIQNISNNIAIGTGLIFETIPLRIKQSSDQNVRSKFSAIDKIISKNYALCSSMEKIQLNIKENYISILASQMSYEEILAQMCQLNCSIIDDLHDALIQEHNDLLGSLGENHE
ncbi:MAG: hypothetical protein SFT93_05930 [Rickettsiaceae bacterium]|nr:hypothetical protein [Rickettsiaceae bacterium]